MALSIRLQQHLAAAAIGLIVLMPTVVAQEPLPSDEPEEVSAGQPEPASTAEGEGSETQRPYSELWREFVDATRGLVTWDLLNGRLTLRVYVRLQLDATVAQADSSLEEAVGNLDDGINVRRFEVFATGTIDKHLSYTFGWDFGADGGLWNAYVEGIDKGLTVFGYDLGKFRVGFFQEPFSLERITSNGYSDFLERSLPVWTFAPGNNLGFMVHNAVLRERMTWALGSFSIGAGNEENASNSTLSVSTRLTGVPLYRKDGRRLVHLGVAVSNRQPESGDTRYRSRPEARFIDRLVDTGTIDSSRIKLYGAELAVVSGSLWAQAESIHSDVTSAQLDDVRFQGSYLQVGYFLTGEVRPYLRDEGIFGHVVPKAERRKPFAVRPSRGAAYEIAGRISNVDLDDKTIRGGELTDFSLGFNWYPNATSRIMFNYIHADVKDVGHANIFLLRYQFRPLPR
jgi:phosphate-selective porin OprO/OprP